MAAYQCPRCELRFDLKPMLADHLGRDHGATPEQVSGLLPPAATTGLRGDPGAEGADVRTAADTDTAPGSQDAPAPARDVPPVAAPDADPSGSAGPQVG